MRWSDRKLWAAMLVVAVAGAFVARDDAAGQSAAAFDVGLAASERELRSWDIDVVPDGTGLPAGQGSVAEGKAIYDAKCMGCHGVEGRGEPMDRLAGGLGTLTSTNPVRTIGSYWPYATTIFDYVRRAMPLDSPQSLPPEDVYAITAYLLYLNGIAGPDAIMNAQTLPAVRMPNQSAFGADPRPDVSSLACIRDCR